MAPVHVPVVPASTAATASAGTRTLAAPSHGRRRCGLPRLVGPTPRARLSGVRYRCLHARTCAAGMHGGGGGGRLTSRVTCHPVLAVSPSTPRKLEESAAHFRFHSRVAKLVNRVHQRRAAKFRDVIGLTSPIRSASCTAAPRASPPVDPYHTGAAPPGSRAEDQASLASSSRIGARVLVFGAAWARWGAERELVCACACAWRQVPQRA